MFKVGDKVKLRGFQSGEIGEIIEINPNNVYVNKVKWSANESRFADNELELVSTQITLGPGEIWLPEGYKKDNFVDCKGPVCQCGVDTLGYGKHSDWCEKHD